MANLKVSLIYDTCYLLNGEIHYFEKEYSPPPSDKGRMLQRWKKFLLPHLFLPTIDIFYEAKMYPEFLHTFPNFWESKLGEIFPLIAEEQYLFNEVPECIAEDFRDFVLLNQDKIIHEKFAFDLRNCLNDTTLTLEFEHVLSYFNYIELRGLENSLEKTTHAEAVSKQYSFYDYERLEKINLRKIQKYYKFNRKTDSFREGLSLADKNFIQLGLDLFKNTSTNIVFYLTFDREFIRTVDFLRLKGNLPLYAVGSPKTLVSKLNFYLGKKNLPNFSPKSLLMC